MLYGILIFVFVISWYLASWPFRLAYVAFPCLLFWNWFDYKVVHSEYTLSQLSTLKMMFLIPTLAVVTFVIGTVLGVLRRGSTSHAEYATKRRRFFIWLTGFGLAWGLPYVILIKAIEIGVGQTLDDATLGFMFTKLFGTPILVVYLVMALSFRWLWRKATRQRTPELGSSSAVDSAA